MYKSFIPFPVKFNPGYMSNDQFNELRQQSYCGEEEGVSKVYLENLLCYTCTWNSVLPILALSRNFMFCIRIYNPYFNVKKITRLIIIV